MARRERGADLAGERDGQKPLLVRRTRIPRLASRVKTLTGP